MTKTTRTKYATALLTVTPELRARFVEMYRQGFGERGMVLESHLTLVQVRALWAEREGR